MDAELRQLMVLTIRSVHLTIMTSTGIAFVPMAKSYLWPTKSLQIVVSLLSAKEVSSILEELKQFMNEYRVFIEYRVRPGSVPLPSAKVAGKEADSSSIRTYKC